MPTKPKAARLTGTSVDILNAIRNNATTNYQNYIPKAEPNVESIREIGAIIMDNPGLKNELFSALMARIARVIILSKTYENPWARFKKGYLEFGETVEEIFVSIAEPFDYDPEVAEKEVFKREQANVQSAFYTMNYQKFYKTTIQNNSLKTAFLSWDGVTDLISKITESLYTAANYDEFLVMKYVIAINILRGRLYPVQIPSTTPENMKLITAQFKAISNELEFMSTNYNAAGVQTYTNKNDQYLIVNAAFDATMDVEVLASAFNMNKVEFMGHRVLVDGFGVLDIPRLNKLIGKNINYYEFSQDELNALNQIPAILVNDNWFMIFDNLYEFTENYNGQGMYWNYFYHVWKTFGVSPFSQAISFVSGAPAITEITITPSETTVSPGQRILLSANVMTENFAPRTLNWSSDNENVIVDIHGMVTVNVGASGTAKITATSTFDSTKTATATITVA